MNISSPATAGQRPSFSGYGRRAGTRRPVIAPAARPIARHGLNARKTSPNRIDTATSPTQKVIMMKVGREVVGGRVGPDVAGDDHDHEQRHADRAAQRSRRRGCRARAPMPSGSGRHGGFSSRGRGHSRASAANETTSTAAAPQANSHSSIGSGVRWIGPPCALAVAGDRQRGESAVTRTSAAHRLQRGLQGVLEGLRPNEPSSRAVILPSAPTTNSHGSVRSRKALSGSRRPACGSLST